MDKDEQQVGSQETASDSIGAVAERENNLVGPSDKDPSPDGTIVGIVSLNPATQNARLSDLCFVEGRAFERDKNPLLRETNAFAVFAVGSQELERVPFLSSQLIGGSMEFAPVRGFFDEPPPPDSRDPITLPYLDADLWIEIEGMVVSLPVQAAELAELPSCSGTSSD